MKRWFILAVALFASAVPAFASSDMKAAPQTALAWGDAMTDAFRSSFLGAKSLTASVDASDQGLGEGHASKVYLGVKGYSIDNVVYDDLMIELRDVTFSANGSSLLIKSIGGGSLTGRISREGFVAKVGRDFPRLSVNKSMFTEHTIGLWGVYSRKAMIPLRATVHMDGNYEVQNGCGALKITSATCDNGLVSADAVAKATVKAAPRISFEHLVVPMAVQSVSLADDSIKVRAATGLK